MRQRAARGQRYGKVWGLGDEVVETGDPPPGVLHGGTGRREVARQLPRAEEREILREEMLSKVLLVPWVATCGRNKQTREWVTPSWQRAQPRLLPA